MRKFSVSVNGKSYDVEVEEISKNQTPVVEIQSKSGSSPVEKTTSKPLSEKAEEPSQKPSVQSQAAAAGAIKVSAPMPGTIIGVKAKIGDVIKKGNVLLVLEAMKMENEIVAPQDGTVASINVSKGQHVNTGELMVSLN
jgi:biotin carboxyl carrier protein